MIQLLLLLSCCSCCAVGAVPHAQLSTCVLCVRCRLLVRAANCCRFSSSSAQVWKLAQGFSRSRGVHGEPLPMLTVLGALDADMMGD